MVSNVVQHCSRNKPPISIRVYTNTTDRKSSIINFVTKGIPLKVLTSYIFNGISSICLIFSIELNPQDKFFPLFAHLYAHTKELYQKVKRRKNGEDSFLHPLNIVVTLNRAKMSDALTLCVGLAHDLIEEKVDLYTEINHLGQDAQSIREIDQQEKLFLAELEQSLSSFCQKKGYPQDLPHKIILAVHLLTRNKKESYYHYLSEIF